MKKGVQAGNPSSINAAGEMEALEELTVSLMDEGHFPSFYL